MKKRLRLKQSTKEWLAIRLFVSIMYLAIFAWLFDDRWLGLVFTEAAMCLIIIGEIIYRIIKKVAKKLLTKLAK